MRNEVYIEIINESVKKLLEFQDIRKGALTEGCFFYPYWRNKKENFVNSRWQEGVLSLSWYFNKFNNEEIWERIVKGIDFWCKLQHSNGTFPENSRYDQSFGATAFSTLAIINSLILTNYSKEKWIEKIKKSCNYIVKHDDFAFIRNEMAASLALLKAGEYLHEPSYLQESEKKLNLVLKNQNNKGYFNEKGIFDLSHNSLILELLGHYYLSTKDRMILDSATKFINFFYNLDLNAYRKFRKADWVIIGGFEIFSNEMRSGKEALIKALNNFNFHHLDYDNNLCTDIYRLCYAYDNFKEDLEHIELKPELNLNKNIYYQYRKSKFLDILRPLGFHNIMRIKQRLF